MNKKQIKRITELELKAKSSVHLTSKEIDERGDLIFLRNKENVNMRLSGINKYYNAHQCYDFLEHIKTSG